MKRNRIELAVLTAIVAVLLTSCAGAVSDEYVIENDPGSVEHIEGTELGRVTLTAAASARLDVQTTPVVKNGRGLVVPMEAVLVDPEGVWWVYTNPESHVFVRHEVAMERQHHGQAHLSAGPPAGTDVVTVGVAELYGIETDIGH